MRDLYLWWTSHFVITKRRFTLSILLALFFGVTTVILFDVRGQDTTYNKLLQNRQIHRRGK